MSKECEVCGWELEEHEKDDGLCETCQHNKEEAELLSDFYGSRGV